MRDKLKTEPVMIDIVAVIFLNIAICYAFKGDVFGFASSFALTPKPYHVLFQPVLQFQLEFYSLLLLVISAGLYFLRKWAYFFLICLCLVAMITALMWVKCFALAVILVLIFEREYFYVGSFIRPEFKNYVHVDYGMANMPEKIDIEERKDLRMEDLIEHNKLEEGLEYASGMVDVARVMGDVRNIIYYEKYIEKIHKIQRRIIRR